MPLARDSDYFLYQPLFWYVRLCWKPKPEYYVYILICTSTYIYHKLDPSLKSNDFTELTHGTIDSSKSKQHQLQGVPGVDLPANMATQRSPISLIWLCATSNMCMIYNILNILYIISSWHLQPNLSGFSQLLEHPNYCTLNFPWPQAASSLLRLRACWFVSPTPGRRATVQGWRPRELAKDTYSPCDTHTYDF